MAKDLKKLAKEIIENNEYLSLATVDETGKPWISIMAYAFDEKYNFYFISLPTSRHSLHIKNNNYVSFSIFDSQQLFGQGIGLQIEGKITESNDTEFPNAKKIYFERQYPYGNINNEFVNGITRLLTDKIYRIYKINITTCWINDPDADRDKRIKILLNK